MPTFSGVKIEKLLGVPSAPRPNQFYLVETGGVIELYLSASNQELVLLGTNQNSIVHTSGVVFFENGLRTDSNFLFDSATNTLSIDRVVVSGDPYDSSWNGDFSVATKNDIWDKIETLSGGGITGSGTNDFIPKWSGGGISLTDSNIEDTGDVLRIFSGTVNAFEIDTTTGFTQIGDFGFVGNSTYLQLNDAIEAIVLSSGLASIGLSGFDDSVIVTASNNVISVESTRVGGRGSLYAAFDFQGFVSQIGDVNSNGNSTRVSVDDSADEILLSAGTVTLEEYIGSGVLTLDSSSHIVSSPTLSLALGGTGASLSDPGADKILFWDDSASTVTWLTLGTNLSITGTTINASGGGGTPAGLNTEVQFNNSGAFGASSNFKYNGSNLVVLVPITSPGAGANSERFGISSTSAGGGSTAFGYGAQATSDESVAIGALAEVAGTYGGGVAVGKSATCNNTYGNGVAIGKNATVGTNAGGTESPMALGASSSATGNKATAVGSGANASGSSAFAMGYNAVASGINAIAVGYQAQGTGSENSLGFGTQVNVSGNTAIGIGATAAVSGERGIGIGESVSVAHTKSIALGKSATTTADNQFVIGSASAPITEFRQVYDGSTRYVQSLSSAGVTTFDTVGSAPKFVFSDDVELSASKTLKVGGSQLRGYTSAAADPTTTEFPNDKDWGIHKNTSTGDIFFAFNDGGTIYGIVLGVV